QPETRHGSKCEIVQPAEERSGSGLSFHKLECCAEVGMSCQQIALLARRRRKPVAPKRNVVNDWGKLPARRKVRLDPRGKDDEVEGEGAGSVLTLATPPLSRTECHAQLGCHTKFSNLRQRQKVSWVGGTGRSCRMWRMNRHRCRSVSSAK